MPEILQSLRLFHADRLKEHGLEIRREQRIMARAISRAIWHKEKLVVEAGTGTGKSLAYLLPLLEVALDQGVRVAVSTDTRALQRQLLEKDTPQAAKILGREVRAALCMGAANYVCKRKLGLVLGSGAVPPDAEAILADFLAWEEETESGNITEFQGALPGAFRSSIVRDPDQCLARRCPNFAVSHYFVERERQEAAHLLVMNHSLLAAHMALDFKLLPEFHILVVDEAHALPERVLSSAQESLSVMELHELLPAFGADELYRELGSICQGRFLRMKAALPWMNLQSTIQALSLKIADQEKRIDDHTRSLFGDDEEVVDEKLLLLRETLQNLIRAETILSRFSQEEEEPSAVRWIEKEKDKDREEWYFRLSPLDAGSLLANGLHTRLSTIVFTSATLATTREDGFRYFLAEAGLPLSTRTLQIPSSFDYQRQSVLYLPRNIPDPGQEEEFLEAAGQLISHLFGLTGGGTMVLFSSRRALMQVHDVLAGQGLTIFSQVHSGSAGALQNFLQNNSSLLFGLSSFWKGIDIAGERLRMVVIVKLPFKHPEDPVRESREERERHRGGRPFFTMQLPEATLELRQGFGRLIRSSSDRGVVCIIDPRLKTRSYGESMLRSLPRARRVDNFAHLRTAYAELLS